MTVLPQTFTGACSGACTELPDSTPGEAALDPLAAEPACAAPPVAAIAPVAAATVIRPLRVTCRIAEYLPSTLSRNLDVQKERKNSEEPLTAGPERMACAPGPMRSAPHGATHNVTC
ncbi:hypothetical protein SBADM41S_04817 [Streptomyces badius]